ncbi:ABC transporter substrate-binding protein [Nocardia otitidiscaviarum]|uniref:ABC transporter substrate-binding protein n=1 Tax=Nocardia otitidiscaviarum TaxID=1823 RepID=UPI001894C4A1|nr:ABC transporter substrate-binding protein [Nocardia otitidiscaviarum]MBF6238155.1 ABC transporter substrate-binding protein [Nocardia otitidiscaviarum]
MSARRLAAAVLALATALVTACGETDANRDALRPDGSVDLAAVTLRIGDQKGTGTQALLEAAGELKDIPYRIEWSQYTSGPPMLEAINAGAVDIGGVGNAPPVFAAAAGADIRIVSAYLIGTGGQAVVVPRDSPLREPNDLRGKKIAVAKGSSAHHHLLSVLTAAGLGFADIEPQYLQPADALAALSTGRVDAWASWDPYTAQAQQQADARILVDGNGYVPGDSFYVAGRRALDSPATAAALRDLLARIARAHAWVNGDTEAWATTFAQVTGLPVAVTRLAVARAPYRDHPIDDATVAAEQQVADAFAAAGLIPGRVAIADFVDTRFNDLFTPA